MKPLKFSLYTLIILISSKLFACQCKTKTLIEWQKSELENSEFIFIGEVFEINKSELTFRIRVIESFNNKTQKDNIFIGKNWEYCSPYVAETGKWIVYGNNENGFLKLNMCGISRPFNNPMTLTKNHIPPLPKLNEEKNKDDKVYKEYLNKAITDLEIEIIALRKLLNKKIKKTSR